MRLLYAYIMEYKASKVWEAKMKQVKTHINFRRHLLNLIDKISTCEDAAEGMREIGYFRQDVSFFQTLHHAELFIYTYEFLSVMQDWLLVRPTYWNVSSEKIVIPELKKIEKKNRHLYANIDTEINKCLSLG